MKINRKSAFTLAETLITLMIIGVLASLTIPSLIKKIDDYTLEKQRNVFEKKLTEGLRRMRVDGKLEQKYESTMDFVKEMKKYFKTAAICDENSIDKCFTKKFHASTQDGTASKDFEADLMTRAKYLSTNLEDYDNPAGIALTDGTLMVIVYKKDCIGPAESDTTGNLTKCIGYIYDVNNEKAPNKLSSDVISNLPLIYPYGLSFEILNKKVYHNGDCETVNGEEICLSGNPAEFCRAIGGTVPTFEQLHQMQTTVYDEEIIDMFNSIQDGEDLSIPEAVQINNPKLLNLLGASSGKMVTVHTDGYGFYYFPDIETGLAFLSGQGLENDDVTLCTAK